MICYLQAACNRTMQRARADRPSRSTGASSCSVEFVVVIVESRLLRESLIWRKALPFLAQPRDQLSSEWRFAIASARLVYPPHRSGRRGRCYSATVRGFGVYLWSCGAAPTAHTPVTAHARETGRYAVRAVARPTAHSLWPRARPHGLARRCSFSVCAWLAHGRAENGHTRTQGSEGTCELRPRGLRRTIR